MSPGQANSLDAFIKTAQYLAGLTTQQDVWSETGKLLVNFWGAHLGGFGERRSNGEIVIRHWTFSAGLSKRLDLASEVQEDIAEVLNSGFLTWRYISSLPEPLEVAFLPITQKSQVTRVLMVGHRTSGMFPNDLLNTYLALAGLVGTTAERLASEAELRKHRRHLEELVGERTAKLTKAIEQLQREIMYRQRVEDALQKTHDELELRVEERTTELENAKQAIAAERHRLYDILETMPVMVCLLTQEYRVAFANRSFREKFGEDNGRHCFDYRFGLKEPCDSCETYNVLKTGKPHHWEFSCPDGSIIDAYDFPFTDTAGSPLILEIDIDITVRKRVEEELIRSNLDLQQFAYVASHDLQEPLRNVTGCLQLLEKKYKNKLDADADQYIHYAVEGAVRMKALILDLLEYSRIATKGKPSEPTECDRILAEAIENLKSAITEAGAVITHDPLPTIPADDTQLLQVFQNLIGNAIKFRREGPPRIHVSAEKNRNEWVFSIRDNGIGIRPEYLKKIFVIFQRLNKRNQYAGTGMGLAMVKKAVERHGGRVWVQSEPGKGTTFYFSMPDRGLRT
jgi:signal transduction histidine kinase